jgi:hypothetical protein
MHGRRGFSLLVVLLISLVGMIMVGAMMQIMTVNSGAGRAASTISRDYNLLVSEVEKARARIIESLGNAQVPKRPVGMGMITAADMLLVEEGEERRTLSPKEMGLYGLGGTSGAVTVKIYDMQYAASDVSPAMDPTEMNSLPPSLILSGKSVQKDDSPTSDNNLTPGDGGGGGGPAANVGAYLIRASLEIDGIPSGTVDLAMVGRSKDS